MVMSTRGVRPMHGVGVVLVAGLLASGCLRDDGGSSSSTTGAVATTVPGSTPSSSEPVPSTSEPTSSTSVPMGANVEALSYLIQGLLTTEQIGGGWMDQGRQVIPPGSNQLSGFLCEEGEAVVAELGGRADPQVSTSFRRSGDVGLRVFESLMWGDRDEVVADFEALRAAVEGCAGAAYPTTELGDLVLTVDEAPALGTAAFSFRFGPAEVGGANPSLSQQMTFVLLSDPEQSVALVVSVGASSITDPAGAPVPELDAAEFSRIATAAVNRILEGL